MRVGFLLCLVLLTSCLNQKVENSTGTQETRWDLSQVSFPLQVGISVDFSEQEVSKVLQTSHDWDTSFQNQVNFFQNSSYVASKGSDLASYQDSVLGIYKLDQWPSELPANALAVTQIFGTRKNIGSSSEYIQIQQADILMNYDRFNFATDYDFQTVLAHELGHFLGLFHAESATHSIMYPSISRLDIAQAPKEQDVTDISNKYGISSLSSSNSRSIASVDSNEQTGKGEPVVILFELLANGQEKVVFKKP